MKKNKCSWRSGRGYRGFTLIELLVVVAIIALLISILLPSLSSAQQARAVVCASNIGSVGKAFHIYLNDNNAMFPPSYVYPKNDRGHYDLMDQPGGHPFGYAHWSWFLFNNGEVNDQAFRCPEMMRGGARAPTRGPKRRTGSRARWTRTATAPRPAPPWPTSRPAAWRTRAMRRLCRATSSRLPRSRAAPAPPCRRNQLVSESRIAETRSVILAADFSGDYTNLSVSAGGNGYLVKSHRPINPFYNIGSGYDEYGADPSGDSGFVYPDQESFVMAWPKPLREIEGKVGVIEGGNFGTELNAIGRHHPGGNSEGGTTNFLYTDGHVERKTLTSTLLGRQWGNCYYSLDDQGDNEVRFLYTTRP